MTTQTCPFCQKRFINLPIWEHPGQLCGCIGAGRDWAQEVGAFFEVSGVQIPEEIGLPFRYITEWVSAGRSGGLHGTVRIES